MAGGATQQAQATPAADTTAQAQAQAAASQDALNAQVLDAYRTQATRQAAPVQSYYRPQVSAVPAQSAMLRIPGFQGVANPFFTPAAQAQQAKSGQAQAASLLDQYNAYKQNNANAMYQARAAQLAQAQAMQKAYQDKVAADKARAEAEAAKAREQELFMQQQSQSSDGGWYSGNSGGDVGIAGLRRRK